MIRSNKESKRRIEEESEKELRRKEIRGTKNPKRKRLIQRSTAPNGGAATAAEASARRGAVAMAAAAAAPAGAKEIDECNRKGNRRKRAKVEAEKSRKGESDVDREMKGD